MHFAKDSPEGPWKEAWRFDVEDKNSPIFKSSHDYSAYSRVDDFKDLLMKCYGGSLENAWKQVLDVNNDGRLSYTEFQQACNRLRNHPDAVWSNVWRSDLQQLFEQLDIDDSGEVRLDDLQRRGPTQPVSRWWRLSIASNFGSTKRLQVVGPVKLFCIVQVKIGGVSRIKASFRFSKMSEGTGNGVDFVTAFDLKTLGVNAETVMLRRIAKRYEVSILLVEDMYRLFCEADEGRGVIVRSAFDRVLMDMHGTDDPCDVPVARLDFFWQQADTDRSGEISFEEFVKFTSMYWEQIRFKSSSVQIRAGRGMGNRTTAPLH